VERTVYVTSGDHADLMATWEEIRAAFADHGASSTLMGVTPWDIRASSSRSKRSRLRGGPRRDFPG
jgi:hypothetical protein